MIRRSFVAALQGDRLRARAARGAILTFFGFGGAQALRLAGNLILTRLLAPEFFGLMALVMVVLTALEMFSDTGIRTSIVQSRRGDDPDFLNTAWTVQVLRGGLLWMIVLLAAPAVAALYEQPDLAGPLQLAGALVVFSGLQSTRLATANRHLILGRLTALELGAQLAGVAATVLLAVWLRSVWALAIGGLVAPILIAGLSHVLIPGMPNRLRWEWPAVRELFTFGKFIFFSSILGFLLNNGDRAILGKLVSLETLGIYTIGFFLATVPLMLSHQMGNRVLLPLYRAVPPEEGVANQLRLRRARLLVGGGLVGMSLIFGIGGQSLVDLLYDPRYHAAGAVVVLLSLAMQPTIIVSAYSLRLLASGNSRDFMMLLAVSATLQTSMLYLGVTRFGVMGAIAAPLLATLITYPLTAFVARRGQAWDPKLDAGLMTLALAGAWLALWLNPDAIGQVLSGL